MIIRNKLGTFEFDDNVNISHAKLIANGVMGQYFNPKPRTPNLTDEASCYEWVRDSFSLVLCGVPFDLEIHENIHHHVPLDPVVELIKFQQEIRDAKVKELIKRGVETANEAHERVVGQLMDAFPGSYLVGPAAVR